MSKMSTTQQSITAAYQVRGSAHHLRPQRVGGDSDYVFTLQTILIV